MWVRFLNSWVALKENFAPVRTHEKLARAGRTVHARVADGESVREDAFAGRLVEPEGRAHLDQLLSPPLHRAIALEKVHEPATSVAEELHLNMTRVLQHLLHEDAAYSIDQVRFTRAGHKSLIQSGLIVHRPNATPATAAYRLQH